MDSPALRNEPGDRTATARSECAAHGSAAGEPKARATAEDLREHETGNIAEASHSGQDRPLEWAASRIRGGRSGGAFGELGEGEFVHTLNLTDIYSGWTESRALLGKSEIAVQRALGQMQASLPFRLLGVDADNGGEFINWHLKRWCAAQQIQLTRGRPSKKDDHAHIEQKNWTHVRKLLGWERYDTPAAVEAIHGLYREELRLWMNLYLPSVKLEKKVRVGAKVRRVYSPAQTPGERLLASGLGTAEQVAAVQPVTVYAGPFRIISTHRQPTGWHSPAGKPSPQSASGQNAPRQGAAVLGYIANVSTAYGYFFKWLDTGQMSQAPVDFAPEE